jgi:hypothetical protein
VFSSPHNLTGGKDRRRYSRQQSSLWCNHLLLESAR